MIFGVDVVDARYRLVGIDWTYDGNFFEQLSDYPGKIVGKALRIFDIDNFGLVFFDESELLSQAHLFYTKDVKKVIECAEMWRIDRRCRFSQMRSPGAILGVIVYHISIFCFHL